MEMAREVSEINKHKLHKQLANESKYRSEQSPNTKRVYYERRRCTSSCSAVLNDNRVTNPNTNRPPSPTSAGRPCGAACPDDRFAELYVILFSCRCCRHAAAASTNTSTSSTRWYSRVLIQPFHSQRIVEAASRRLLIIVTVSNNQCRFCRSSSRSFSGGSGSAWQASSSACAPATTYAHFAFSCTFRHGPPTASTPCASKREHSIEKRTPR